MNTEHYVYECLCRGISDATWEKMKDQERKDYVKSHPTSRFAEKEKSILNKSKLTPELKQYLDRCLCGDSKIIENKDGSIDIDGSIKLYLPSRCDNNLISLLFDKNWKLKIKFGKVSDNFRIGSSILRSLEGCPTEVGGDFECNSCDGLTSLKGAPKKVGKIFNCSNCYNLKTLEGAPKEVNGCFICESCHQLESFKGVPDVINANFYCGNSRLIKDLKGAPKKINGDFNACYLKSLDGCPKEVTGNFYYMGDSKFNTLFTEEDIRKKCRVKGKVCIKDYNDERIMEAKRKQQEYHDFGGSLNDLYNI